MFNFLYEKNKLEIDLPIEEMPFHSANFLLMEVPESHHHLVWHFNNFGQWMADRGTPVFAGLYLVRRRRRLFKPNVYEVKLLKAYYDSEGRRVV